MRLILYPDLSESDNFKYWNLFENGELSNDLNGKVNESISHQVNIDDLDHLPLFVANHNLHVLFLLE
jgi:hypothetical protein